MPAQPCPPSGVPAPPVIAGSPVLASMTKDGAFGNISSRGEQTYTHTYKAHSRYPSRATLEL
eukprot:289879-Pyramimonas_sp.AAC.1